MGSPLSVKERASRSPHRLVSDAARLTTAQLLRELDLLKQILESRLDGMDRATELIHQHTSRLPSEVDTKVAHLQSITEERFRSIEIQFKERDTRTEQTSKDSKVAVDAALQAAKEAVGEQNKSSALAIAKSEAATTKQIDQMGTLVQTTTAGINDKIDDIKSRLTLIEGRSVGNAAAVVEHREGSNSTWTIIGVVVAVLLGLSGLVITMVQHH